MNIRMIAVLMLAGFSVAAVCVAEDDPVPRFTMTTIGGDGSREYHGDGKPALEAGLEHPTAVAVNSQGIVYIGDSPTNRVRLIDNKGKMQTFMGTGESKPDDKIRKPKKTNVVQAYGVAVDYQDNVYVLNRGHNKIHKITPEGEHSIIAGNGKKGFSGDEGPATEAMVNWPNHLVADKAGNLYIADTGNDRIRKIDTNGIITTIAGSGDGGFAGDGGPATEALIDAPSAMAIDAEGNLYTADFFNHRIRKVDTNGIITTVAGTGDPKYNGDDLPALEANIGEPCGVAVDSKGYIYIGDQENLRVRVVTPAGRLHTVAGIGKVGQQGDGGPAHLARMSNPDIIAFDQHDNLYVPDNMAGLIRKLVRIE